MAATTEPNAPAGPVNPASPDAPAGAVATAAAADGATDLPPAMAWIGDFSTRPIYVAVALCTVAPALLWFGMAVLGGVLSSSEAASVAGGPIVVILPLVLGALVGLLYGWMVPVEALVRGEMRTPSLVEDVHRSVYRIPRRLFVAVLAICLATPAIAIWSIGMDGPLPDTPRMAVLLLLGLPVLALVHPFLQALVSARLDAPLGEIGPSGKERPNRVWSQLVVQPMVMVLAALLLFGLVLTADFLTRRGASEEQRIRAETALQEAAAKIRLSEANPLFAAEHEPAVKQRDAANRVLAALPTAEQLHSRATVRASTATAVFVLLAFAVMLVSARNLLRPLEKLGNAARAVSHGNLHQRPLVLGSQAEFGRLATAYNEMLASLRHLVAYVNRVSDGDLRLRLTGESEMARAINRLVATQAELVRQLTETSIQLNSGAAEIFATSSQSESNATEQASSVEETKRTMKNLLESSSRIAESAHIVYQNAEQTMDNIRLIAERLSDLVAHNQKIGEILDFVKEIADRSDLLALNASLEGTRAGEAGRGFTLVAAEMRRLAENVMDSVKDIKQLVADVRGSSQASVLATEEGMKLGTETTESAKRITFITQQQQTGTEQVSRSMDEISELLNQSVAGSKQVTLSADELKGLSERLQNIIEAFRIDGTRTFARDEQGNGRAPVSRAVAPNGSSNSNSDNGRGRGA